MGSGRLCRLIKAAVPEAEAIENHTIMNQIYWNSYKRLEKEVLALSESIYIDDDQLKVYSPRICDLLVRTSIEIEALAKELYFANSGTQPEDRDLYFDTDCLKLLEDKWSLNKKQILVVSPNFDFSKHENKVLQPLWNAAKRGKPQWKKAYQDVKHDRVNKLKQGKIEHLLKALGALYILNVYYRDSRFYTDTDYNASKIDWGLGSEIFAVKVSKGEPRPSKKVPYEKKWDYEESVYLVKYTDDTILPLLEHIQLIEKETRQESANVVAQILADKMKSGELPTQEEDYNKMVDSLLAQNNYDSFKRVGEKHATETVRIYNGLRFEAVLNKNQY